MSDQTNQDQKKQLQPKKLPKTIQSPVARKHKQVLDNLGKNGGNLKKAILDAGYSAAVAKNPDKITNSKTWAEVVAAEFPDDAIAERHNSLLKASRLEDKVFPTGPKLTANKIPGSEDLSDEEIRELFVDADCKVLRILHKTDHRVVYFTSPDSLARDKALDKVYKIKGRYAEDAVPRSPTGNTYNFIFSGPVQEKVKAIEGEIKNMLIKKPDVQNDQ